MVRIWDEVLVFLSLPRKMSKCLGQSNVALFKILSNLALRRSYFTRYLLVSLVASWRVSSDNTGHAFKMCWKENAGFLGLLMLHVKQ